jgi:hypothetical protein
VRSKEDNNQNYFFHNHKFSLNKHLLRKPSKIEDTSITVFKLVCPHLPWVRALKKKVKAIWMTSEMTMVGNIPSFLVVSSLSLLAVFCFVCA